MRIVIAKTFADRHELDMYVACLGEAANVSLEMSRSEAELMALDESTTVHGASVSVAPDPRGPKAAGPVLRGVPGKRRRSGKK